MARLQFALKLRTKLVERLAACGFGPGDVWFDRSRLNPGDEWELAIVEALHGCKAAVLLLTPEALQSPWVLREATVLADRRARWAGLRLVPVLCAGVDYKALAALPAWAALNVARWQPVQAGNGAWRGKESQKDIAQIVKQVAAQLEALAEPSDPALEGWTDEVRSFLDDLERRKLRGRLKGAAAALRVKPPLAWDDAALGQLARTLLQSDVVEPDAGGQLRFPLPQALGELMPGVPQLIDATESERQFCQRLKPLAAPPGAAVALGAARASDPVRPPPVLLQADDPCIGELAAFRSICGKGWVRRFSGVGGEGAGPSVADIEAANREARRFAVSNQPCIVVAALQPLAGEDVGRLSTELAARLDPKVALVAVVGRGAVAPAAAGSTAVLVEVPQAEEDAAVRVAEHVGLLCRPKDSQPRTGT